METDISKSRLDMMYQKLYKEVRAIIKDNVCMNFYNEKEPIYLETDAKGVRVGAGLLQGRNSLQFPQDKVPDNTAF